MLSVALPAILFATPILAQTPSVSLLTDLPLFAKSGPIAIRALLPLVALRKGSQFHFGSTHDLSVGQPAWTDNIFKTVFGHIVAENDCKWQDTEPTRGVSNLTECIAVNRYAGAHGATFRGHNTFWHQQTPSWLPGNISASDLVQNVIPEHVKAEISGLGTSVTSWDVMNELIGDLPTSDMDALACVQSKKAWPTVTMDGGNTTLVGDLSFVHAAFSAAKAAAAPGTKLVYNDYSTGGNDAKTQCAFKLLADIQKNADIPYSRLAIGFQSHVTARPGWFVNKNDLAATFARLKALGADALVTEIDIAQVANTTADARYQAAIWGDYLDTCLYADNCHEFINWDTRDDQSWLTPSATSAGLGTLFNSNGQPKIVAYELQARFARYIVGRPELCATALGNSTCKASF